MKLKSVVGVNALTVNFSSTDDVAMTKMFFCPYRKNIVGSYLGDIQSIEPGYDPNYSPQFIVRPHASNRTENINYIFADINWHEKVTVFWVQNQYFDPNPVKSYYCFNCQAPSLYFDDKKTVTPANREVRPGDRLKCPNCGIETQFMGIVNIKRPVLE